MGVHGLGRDAAEIEAHAAAEDGHRDLPDLGGCEDEFHVGRRLLERLQEAVEGRRREHVHFVDDVDFVGRLGRRVFNRIDDLANVGDTGVRGRIHLDDVDVAPLDDGLIVDALAVEIESRMAAGVVLEIDRPGEDARGGGLADAADAGEHEGVRNAVGLEGVAQRLHHRVLADQGRKAGRPVFPRQHEIRRLDPGGSGRRHLGVGEQCISHGKYIAIRAANRKSGGGENAGFMWEKARGWQRPVKVSLGLLPSGPDPVGEEHVRANLSGRYIGQVWARRKPYRDLTRGAATKAQSGR